MLFCHRMPHVVMCGFGHSKASRKLNKHMRVCHLNTRFVHSHSLIDRLTARLPDRPTVRPSVRPTGWFVFSETWTDSSYPEQAILSYVGQADSSYVGQPRRMWATLTRRVWGI